jgi:DNA-3-methyladenine glycosylase
VVRLLPPAFFHRPAEVVARDLLGCRLESRIGGVTTGGRIIETEAYLGVADPASHAFRGRRNAQNASIYSAPGTWYVYRSYGIHWCINLVTAPEGAGAAVLVRAIAPEVGAEVMRRRRGGRHGADLTGGPGKLAQALGVDRTLDGQSMMASAVVVLEGERVPDARVQVTPRIGITKGVEAGLRFVVVP